MHKSKFKITKHEDVGICTINDLSKEELIECIDAVLTRDRSARFWFERRVIDIADRRRAKKLSENEEKGNEWISLQREYEELLRPYAGEKIKDIPMDIINQGAELERKIRKAQEEYFATLG